MKQHITIKQLKQLSPKGEKKLGKWWNSGKPTKHASGGMVFHPKFGYLPLLSIGQMLEFLQEYKNSPFLISGLVSLFKDGKIDVDVLWEAVKEILNA